MIALACSTTLSPNLPQILQIHSIANLSVLQIQNSQHVLSVGLRGSELKSILDPSDKTLRKSRELFSFVPFSFFFFLSFFAERIKNVQSIENKEI